jgi:hypothetical protein
MKTYQKHGGFVFPARWRTIQIMIDIAIQRGSFVLDTGIIGFDWLQRHDIHSSALLSRASAWALSREREM